MRLAELLMGMNCGCAAAADTEVTGVCSNSDKVSPGDVFVAVKGSRTDSHELIASAVSRGASAVICQIPPSEDIGVPVALVSDSRRALALAADNFYGNPSGALTGLIVACLFALIGFADDYVKVKKRCV